MRPSLNRLLILLALFTLTSANSRPSTLTWDKWQYLIGEWEAAGQGSHGAGRGRFSFTFDLQQRVIVHRSHTDYPKTADRPAFSHDDLMVIYADDATQKFRADYFDNEGHVIHYTAEFSADGQALTFLSDPLSAQPRFRLTYLKLRNDALGIKFEIAPPGAPEGFKVYVEGQATRSG